MCFTGLKALERNLVEIGHETALFLLAEPATALLSRTTARGRKRKRGGSSSFEPLCERFQGKVLTVVTSELPRAVVTW